MTYRLNVLGSLDLKDSSGASINAVLQQPRRLALLIYLALAERDKMVKRDTLLGVFWPDTTQENGRRALSQAIHFLRKSLGSEAIINRGNDDVGLNLEVVECDAARFLAAARSGDLETAAANYAGDLLPGFFATASPEFDQWLDCEREQLRRTAAEVFWSSAEEARSRGQMVSAAASARRAAELATDSESATRRLIEFLDSIDDRAGALDVYENLVRRLQTDFETMPSAKTRDLAARIRRDGASVEVPAPRPADASRLRTLPWVEIKRHGRTLVGASIFMFAFVSLWGLSKGEAVRTDASLAIEAPEVFDASLRDEAAEILSDASAALIAVPDLKVLENGVPVDEKLNAHFVLKPKVTQRDGELRVSASLVDTETGAVVRNASFNVSGDDAGSLKAVALDMAEFARKEMGKYLKAADVTRISGPNAEVLIRGTLSRMRADSLLGVGQSKYAILTLDQADDALEDALKGSRSFDLYLKRAEIAYDKAWVYRLPPMSDISAMNKAIETGVAAADKAISLAHDNALGHEVRGLLLYRQWLMNPDPRTMSPQLRDEAERSLRRATELNKKLPRSLSALSSILIAKGEYLEAYWAAELGVETDTYLDASDALTANLFTAAAETGNGPAAERWCTDMRRRMPGSWSGAYCELQVIALKAKPTGADLNRAEAIIALAATDEHSEPFAPLLNAVTAVAYSKAGNVARARVLLANAERGTMSAEILPFKALALKIMGDHSAARGILAKYVGANPSARFGVTRSVRYAGIY